MLPRLDGITLCKRLRAVKCNAFILMLTARDTTPDKIIGLDAGGDDYLVKPFELEELAARIRALSSGGSGLGLAIAQAIDENHGGLITVTSQLGIGSCFTVYLSVGI